MGIVWLTLTCIGFLTACYFIGCIFFTVLPSGLIASIYYFLIGPYCIGYIAILLLKYKGRKALKNGYYEVQTDILILRGYNRFVRLIAAIIIKQHITVLKAYKLWKPF